MVESWGMNIVPNDFSWVRYLELNPDVKRNPRFNSPIGATNHWKQFGIKEGRKYKDNSDDPSITNYGYIKFPNFDKKEPISRGFYSNYFFVLSMIIDAHNKNLKPYVNLDNTSFVNGYNPYTDTLPLNTENTWDWWFDQEKPTEYDYTQNIKYSSEYFSHSDKMWKRKNLKEIRKINDTYIKIKPHILGEIDEYYTENLKGKKVLGVMARGSEMNKYHPEYGNQTIETWIESTKNVIKKHPEINLIFLVTEESNYIPIYLNEFPDTKYLKDVFRRTTETDDFITEFPMWSSIVNPRENHTKRLGEECLIQSKLLGMCDYLLIKQCGTSSAAILFADKNLKDVIYT